MKLHLMSRRILGILAVASLVHSAGVAAPEDKSALDEMEATLLGADVVIDFHVTASGPVMAKLRGELIVKPGNVATLTAKGTLQGKKVDLALKSDGKEMTIKSARGEKKEATPKALNEALLIGFTRMGMLHNVFRLAGGAPPDHAKGGVKEWVTVKDVKKEDGTVSFGIVVSKRDSGSAKLKMAGDSAPSKREQSVKFPTGEMTVKESYLSVRVKRFDKVEKVEKVEKAE